MGPRVVVVSAVVGCAAPPAPVAGVPVRLRRGAGNGRDGKPHRGDAGQQDAAKRDARCLGRHDLRLRDRLLPLDSPGFAPDFLLERRVKVIEQLPIARDLEICIGRMRDDAT